MPKVSVIIPVYGVEKYIERCARSLFEQTLDDIEYIFVDDCSPDRSIEILKSIIEEYRLRFAEEKKTVRIERMPTNSGLPAVRRHGIQLATGDFIIHCDSDDWVDLTMYERLYTDAIQFDAGISVCDFFNTDGINHTAVANHYSADTKKFISDLFDRRNSWSLCNKLIKNEYYHDGIIFPNNNMGEDMALILQLSFFANKIAVLNVPLYYYFQNPESITKVQNKASRLMRFSQVCSNVEIVELFYNDACPKNWINHGILKLKFMEKMYHLPFGDKDYLITWRKQYFGLLFKTLLLSSISIKNKVKYLGAYLGIYKIK